MSFAAKRVAPAVPLWLLFIAVQLLDVFWAPFILLGIEKVRIVFGLVMLAIQAYIFFGPPPVSAGAAALTALIAYGIFAAVAARLERPSARRA